MFNYVLPMDGILNVVWDWDGTLSNSNEVLCKNHGIDINKITDYNWKKSRLSDEERETMTKLFSSYEGIVEAGLDDDVDEIHKLSIDLKGKVRNILHSLSYKQPATDAKAGMIKRVMPWWDKEWVWLETGPVKTQLVNVGVLVDDSTYELIDRIADMRVAREHVYNKSWVNENIHRADVKSCKSITEAAGIVREVVETRSRKSFTL